jgi:hypothetical protein
MNVVLVIEFVFIKLISIERCSSIKREINVRKNEIHQFPRQDYNKTINHTG